MFAWICNIIRSCVIISILTCMHQGLVYNKLIVLCPTINYFFKLLQTSNKKNTRRYNAPNIFRKINGSHDFTNVVT